MKNNNIIRYISYFCTVCMMFLFYNCTEDDKVVSNYIKLSHNSYTFGVTADTLEIKVDANPEWRAELESDWLKIVNESPNSITIEASSNFNAEARKATLTFIAADVKETVSISQMTEYVNPKYRMVDTSLSDVVISHSGKYLAAVQTRLDDNEYYYTPVIIDVLTGEVEKCGPEQTKSFTVVGVTADKKVFYWQDDGFSGYFKNNEKYFYDAPTGYKNPAIRAISEDGRVVAGDAKGDDFRSYPVRWINEAPEALSIPEKDVVGGDDNNHSIIVRGCSADGNIIIGEMQDDAGTAVYWKNGEVDYVSKDKAAKDSITITTMWGGKIDVEMVERATLTARTINNVSVTGKYIAVGFLKAKKVDGVKKRRTIPAFFNTETGETVFIDELPVQGSLVFGNGITVSDEENMAFFSVSKLFDEFYNKSEVLGGYAYDLSTGEILTTQEYMQKKRSLVLGDNISLVRKVCTDKEVVFGDIYAQLATGARFLPWYITPAISE